MTLNSGSCRIC